MCPDQNLYHVKAKMATNFRLCRSSAIMASMMRPVFLGVLLVLGCEPVDQTSVCDGQAQPGEDPVDSPYDQDGDGFFDGNNPDRAAAYAILDCNDYDPEVNPEAVEIPCNDYNDDCDDATLDWVDADEDGVPACEDCDDHNQEAFPEGEEDCYTLADDDCDDKVNESCAYDYNGSWTLTSKVQYSCMLGVMRINFQTFNVLEADPDIGFDAVEGKPGPMIGKLEDSLGFNVSRYIDGGKKGGCNETYSLKGTFTSEERFKALFTAEFAGVCLGCQDQSWRVVGFRDPAE